MHEPYSPRVLPSNSVVPLLRRLDLSRRLDLFYAELRAQTPILDLAEAIAGLLASAPVGAWWLESEIAERCAEVGVEQLAAILAGGSTTDVPRAQAWLSLAHTLRRAEAAGALHAHEVELCLRLIRPELDARETLAGWTREHAPSSSAPTQLRDRLKVLLPTDNPLSDDIVRALERG